jgi:dTDP-4-amino-4,6-dideoxygalactose transaminase
MRLGAEEEKAVVDVLRSKRLFRYYGPGSGGSKVDEFEGAFARHLGTGRAVAVSSGSAALVCGLAALGVGPGDEVIVPAYTWIASAGAVVAAGAVPVLAEIDQSLTLDAGDAESKITHRTRAIMPVHMRGAPCEMHRIMRLARSRGLKVLEDVAQATGGSFRGQRLGSIGDAGAFSFQFNKIITCGEGGIASTRDAEIHERILMYHDVIGGLRNGIPKGRILNGLNFRMSELHGAIMLVQLRR